MASALEAGDATRLLELLHPLPTLEVEGRGVVDPDLVSDQLRRLAEEGWTSVIVAPEARILLRDDRGLVNTYLDAELQHRAEGWRIAALTLTREPAPEVKELRWLAAELQAISAAKDLTRLMRLVTADVEIVTSSGPSLTAATTFFQNLTTDGVHFDARLFDASLRIEADRRQAHFLLIPTRDDDGEIALEVYCVEAARENASWKVTGLRSTSALSLTAPDLERMLTSFNAACRRKDAKGLLAHFSPGAVIELNGGQWADRSEVRLLLRELVAKEACPFYLPVMSRLPPRLRQAGPGMVWGISWNGEPDGTSHWYRLDLVKQKDTWLVSSIREIGEPDVEWRVRVSGPMPETVPPDDMGCWPR